MSNSYVPCNCGAVFDDVYWMVIYPHQQVHGTLTLMPAEGYVNLGSTAHVPYDWSYLLKMFVPHVGWKWLKWTFGFWIDPANHTYFGIDVGPLEIVWRSEEYRP